MRLHRLPLRHHHHNGLHPLLPRAVNVHRPDNLCHGHGGKSFKLEFDHGEGLRQRPMRDLNHLEEHVLRRKHGDVQPGLKQGAPGFGPDLLGKGLLGGQFFPPAQNEAFALGLELPDLRLAIARLDNATGLPLGRRHLSSWSQNRFVPPPTNPDAPRFE